MYLTSSLIHHLWLSKLQGVLKDKTQSERRKRLIWYTIWNHQTDTLNNFDKKVQDFYKGSYKTVRKEIQEGRNKWRDMLCSRTGDSETEDVDSPHLYREIERNPNWSLSKLLCRYWQINSNVYMVKAPEKPMWYWARTQLKGWQYPISRVSIDYSNQDRLVPVESKDT